ncbi:MAG: asparaginase [Vampirovibrionales bacterium]
MEQGYERASQTTVSYTRAFAPLGGGLVSSCQERVQEAVLESVHPVTLGWLTLPSATCHAYTWQLQTPTYADAMALPNRVCWRSVAKPFQFLPLWLSLSPHERAVLPTEAIAIACASHSGMPTHLAWVQWWLNHLPAQSQVRLCCGVHPPLGLQGLPMSDPLVTAVLGASGVSSLHHNCSGKHSAFLNWMYRSHPEAWHSWRNDETSMQYPEAVLNVWCRLIETWLLEQAIPEVSSLSWHYDGCTLPVPSTSFETLARAYHALWKNPVTRPILLAMAKHPELVAGTTAPTQHLGDWRLDTYLMRQSTSSDTGTCSSLVSKSGAEALVCVLRLSTGEVCVCKVWTGHQPTRDSLVPQLLQSHGWLG